MKNENKTLRKESTTNIEMEIDMDQDLRDFAAGTYKAGSSPLLKQMEAMFGPLPEEKE